MAKRKSKPKRARRTFSDEFKREAVQLIVAQGLTISEAAQSLGIHANLLRGWKRRLAVEDEDARLTEDEQMELARLRAENKRLRMERDILKKATAFFANEKN